MTATWCGCVWQSYTTVAGITKIDRKIGMEGKADYYNPLWRVARIGLDRKFDRNVEGVENIPDTPAIYAPNHILFADSPLVAVSYTEATGKPMRFGAKNEYFEGRGIDDKGKLGRTMRWVMEHGQMIPVIREGGNPRAFQELQKQVAERLDNGDAVALHPEGTRSQDGRLHRFKSGAARMAIALSVPIVPVGIVYDDKSNERKTHVDIIFGEPVMPEEYQSGAYALLPTKLKADAVTLAVENRVADLTGMDQTGTFAILKKLRHLRGNDESSE